MRVEVVEQVRARGGVVRRARLPRRQVERALDAGLLVAPRPGVVADPALGPAALAAVSLGGLLSCAAAARAHQVDLIEPVTTVHVTVPRSRHTRGADPAVVVHRRDAPSLDGLATTLARTAADCARCLPPRDALVVVDQVLARGVERHEVLAHLRGSASRAARALVMRGSAVSGSMGETAARLVIEDAGLHVEPQVYIRGVGWVDLLVEGRLVVEVDGFAYHSDARQFAIDRRRDAALTSMGYLVLRFTWLDVVWRPEYVVATVLAVLARG